MKKKIAILTGATGGIGKAFLKELQKEPMDEIWCIARNIECLNDLKDSSTIPLRLFTVDLASEVDCKAFFAEVEKENPIVQWAILNAGIGGFEVFENSHLAQIRQLIRVNCEAVCLFTKFLLPYVPAQGAILPMASQAAFQPLPYLALYAASKAFVLQFSQALQQEVKKQGKTILTVCPGWVKTPMFLEKKAYQAMHFSWPVAPEKVAKKALKDAKKRKRISLPSFPVRIMRLLSKWLPANLVMGYWKRRNKQFFKQLSENKEGTNV